MTKSGKPWILLILFVSTATVRATPCEETDEAPEDGAATIMEEKLRHSQRLLESLAKEDFEALGASAVIGIRYDATEVMEGVTEVLCYGTAVVVQPDR